MNLFRISPRPFRTVIVGTGFVTLVEMRFASGPRYYSFEGVSAPNQWWKDTLISIGNISEEAPTLPGEYRVGDTTIIIDNTNLEFSILKDQEGFRNVKVAIRRGDASFGAAGLMMRFTGEVADWRFYKAPGQGDRVEFLLRDVSFGRFRQKLAGVFDIIDFPYCPGENLGRLIPIIYGHVEGPEPINGTGRGAIPAYLIDPHNAEPFWTYVCARHPCAEIIDVYHYERLLPHGWYQIATRQYGKYHCQILRFTGEMRDSSKSGPEITFNARGLTETGGSSGTLIENPARQLEHVLTDEITNAGVSPSEIDQPSFNLVKNRFGFSDSPYPVFYRGAFALLNENETYADVIDRFSTSFNLYFSCNRFGKFALYALALDNSLSATNISSFSDSEHILQDSFEIESLPDPITRLQFNYRYQWSMDYFYRQPDDNLPEEQNRLGREVRGSVNLWYVADDFTAASVASERHQYLRENTQRIHFDLPPQYFAQGVNDHIKLTHWQGIHFTGLGYDNQRFRITGLHHSFNPASMRVNVAAIRISEPIAVVIPTFVPVQESLMIGPALAAVGF
jgi:hypothetical protein